MRIAEIKLHNFRIYKGDNEIRLHEHEDRNISLIAGKNGFGKTTFLTSLIWALYGNLMSQVEDKYRIDIKSAGGYDKFLEKLLNRTVMKDFKNRESDDTELSVELHLVDVLIPSIPCKKVVVKRSFNFASGKETLNILIDGLENELTREVGYEVFINDFILPREIAKFFFFDAEKIVTLAEAKSKSELRSLSKAYSEVLGIKKYEDLKQNLNTLLTKLRRSGVSKVNKSKLDELVQKEKDFEELIDNNLEKQRIIEDEVTSLKARMDVIQEKLIREGNEISLDQLKELKLDRDRLKEEHKQAKNELKKFMEIVPIVIGFNKLEELIDQINIEQEIRAKSTDPKAISKEIKRYSVELLSAYKELGVDSKLLKQLSDLAKDKAKNHKVSGESSNETILLDFTDEKSREIIAVYNFIKDSFRDQFKQIVRSEKNAGLMLNRTLYKIREAEARKGNPLAQQLREDKLILDERLHELLQNKEDLVAKQAELSLQKASNSKVLSEYDKNYKLVETDKKKYAVTEELLKKLDVLILRIKDEKKYSLQKAILLGLNKLMHKDQFIEAVKVRIEEDVMDIDLLDASGNVIDKDTLSKGEQQLYATALLKALVDESGINFPVFIDSPLQKFDKEHSTNVIKQFYPSISEQVVLFPLLEKELSVKEYDLLSQHLNGVYLIGNDSDGSSVEECAIEDLFKKFNEQNYVLSN